MTTEEVRTLLNFLNKCSHSIQPSDTEFALLVSVTTLEKPEDFSELGFEVVKLKKNSEADLVGSSLKPYNLLKIEQSVLKKKLLGLAAQSGSLATVDGTLGLISGLIQIALDFHELIETSFSPEQAKVLWAIYNTTQQELSLGNIQSAYRTCFKKTITVEKLRKVLYFLVSLKTLKQVTAEKYELLETIEYER